MFNEHGPVCRVFFSTSNGNSLAKMRLEKAGEALLRRHAFLAAFAFETTLWPRTKVIFIYVVLWSRLVILRI